MAMQGALKREMPGAVDAQGDVKKYGNLQMN
jgi:hypothetical protein